VCAAPAQAADWRFADLWLTRDQQGRLAYQHGDYARAATLFADPMWRGVALYRAGEYAGAAKVFALLDSADAHYDRGNALARLGKVADAAASYRAALERRPDWPEAKANLALVEKLIPPDEDQPQEPTQAADQMQFDEQGKKGKAGEVDAAQASAEMWMRGIQTTPAQLLTRKFALETARAKP